MSPTTDRGKQSRWLLIVAIVAPPVIVGTILIPALFEPGPVAEDMWVGANTYGPTSTASAADVQVIHDALHDIGAQCLEATPDLGIMAADVGLIIAFSARYPRRPVPHRR